MKSLIGKSTITHLEEAIPIFLHHFLLPSFSLEKRKQVAISALVAKWPLIFLFWLSIFILSILKPKEYRRKLASLSTAQFATLAPNFQFFLHFPPTKQKPTLIFHFFPRNFPFLPTFSHRPNRNKMKRRTKRQRSNHLATPSQIQNRSIRLTLFNSIHRFTKNLNSKPQTNHDQ